MLDKERLSCAAEELVLRLISAHCRNDSMFDGTERERLLFYMLKDADGLDRVRIFDLDPRYLRLEASRKRTEFAWELLRDENWKAAALAAE